MIFFEFFFELSMHTSIRGKHSEQTQARLDYKENTMAKSHIKNIHNGQHFQRTYLVSLQFFMNNYQYNHSLQSFSTTYTYVPLPVH